MTPLTIIPNYDRKRLKSVGTVAAGEHVEVTILGGADWIQPDPDVLDDSQTLRLRLIFGGKTVAVFPYWTETHEDDLGSSIGPDQWDESQSGEDAVCEINLNTIPAERMLRLGGQCLWVLDDPTNHILYGTGEVQIGAWPRRRGTDTPYDLDGYPDFVEYAKAAVQAAAETAQAAQTNAETARDEATAAKEAIENALDVEGRFLNSASQHAAVAENSATAAAASATAAGNAQTAAETAQGKAEDAQAAAETAQEKAEAWATGGTGGTPSATNNAKHYAEQAAETLEDKADKVEDATEGNFAALDDEGNLTDSGKAASDFAASEHSHAMSEVTGLSEAFDAKGSAETLTNVVNKVATLIGSAAGDDTRSVREIAALAIAAWAAGADARYDTLKEIADWILNDTTGAAKMASDIATLAANKVDKVSGYGLSKNDFTDERRDKLAGIAKNANNYALPTASASALGGVKVGNNLSIDANGVLSATGGGTVDPALSPTSKNPVQNKAVAAALSAKLDGAAAYPAWMIGPPAPYQGGAIVSHLGRIWQLLDQYAGTDSEPGTSEEWDDVLLQDLIDLKQDALSSAQMAAVNSGATAAKVATWDGYAAQIAAKANASDVATALAQKASLADLPYRLVEPGKWEFSDGASHALTLLNPTEDVWIYYYDTGSSTAYSQQFSSQSSAELALSLTFDTGVTATRASLPGHLIDRAVNAVSVSTDTELTLPALVNAGKARDFLVRLAISGSTVPSITFAAPTGETITYETDGDEFPVPDEAGTWLYSFTETAAHTFAVSLKRVNAVSQTQGGV